MIKIWQKYFFKEIICTLFLFLSIFWGLYVIIDYASRISLFRTFHFTSVEIFQYYGFYFLKRMEILLPFAFLIASIRTLTKLNSGNELTALLSSGVPLKILTRPFLLFALSLTLLSYANLEWGYPQALSRLHLLEDSHTSDQYKRSKNEGVQSLSLHDGSLLLFYSFDSSTGIVDNPFWVQSIDTILHIKRLQLLASMPKGEWVEIFRRNENGELVLAESHREMEFPSLRLGDPRKALQLHRPQEQSLSTLYQLMMEETGVQQGKNNLILTALINKIIIPWLPCLVLMIIAPYCLIFSRTPPVFLIYVVGMFGLVSFYLIFNALITLTEHQVVSPWLSLALPFVVIFAISARHYHRILKFY